MKITKLFLIFFLTKLNVGNFLCSIRNYEFSLNVINLSSKYYTEYVNASQYSTEGIWFP